jgi:hypothetical protein
MKSASAEQIDLDVNRSARNHVQFRERFGSGQVSLFNILKAYSNYDKEVAYVQGMSDITAFLLMYLTEEVTENYTPLTLDFRILFGCLFGY